jgi:hypothetical protein
MVYTRVLMSILDFSTYMSVICVCWCYVLRWIRCLWCYSSWVCIHTGQAEKFAWPEVAWPNVAKQTFQLARCGCTLRVTSQTSYMSVLMRIPYCGISWARPYMYQKQAHIYGTYMSVSLWAYLILITLSTQPPAQDNFERPALVPEVKNACTTNVPGTHLNITETEDICGSRLTSNEPSYNKHTHQS